MARTVNIIRMSMRRIIANPREYLLSFIMLQGLYWLIALPTITFLFYEVLHIVGIPGLTDSNFALILQKPLALIIVIALIFILTFFIYYELGFYFLLAYYQQTGQSYTFRSIFKALNRKAKYFLSAHTLLFALYFMLIAPIAAVGMDSTLTSHLKVPDFIVDELMTTTVGKVGWLILLLILLYISLRLVFSVVFFVTEPDCTIRQAIQRSWKATRKKHFLLIAVLGGMVLSFMAIVLVAMLIILSPLFISESLMGISMPILAGIVFSIMQVFIFISGAFVQPILSEAITTLAYGSDQRQPPKTNRKAVLPDLKKWFTTHKGLGAVTVLAFIGLIIFNTITLQNTIYQPTTQVYAHRGYANVALENSIEALQAAAKAGADYVEMDIQETKDGKFVVYHDATLQRLASRSGTIYKMNLDELVGVPIGNARYKSTIPSFEQFIDAAKEADINLLVEMKLHGHESPDMEQKLVDLLYEKDVAHKYIVQSLDKKALARVLDYDPTIATSYLLALNVGSLPPTPTNYIGLEEFSINKTLLNEAAEAGKGIMVWTVNKEDLIHKYMRMNVDGIITNNVDTAVAARDTYSEKLSLLDRVLILLDKM